MQKRTLGTTGISIAPLAFGGNVFGWTIDEATSHNLLDQFVDHGFDLIDTANSYCRWVPGHEGGESEKIIGSWLKKSGKRDKVIIATKVGSDMGLGKPSLTAKHIMEQVEGSLRRLGIEQIDLYQSHFDDLDTTVEETMDAFATLIDQGKVKALGASNISENRLRASINYTSKQDFAGYQTLQPEYNLFARKKYEEEYEPVCIERNISVLTYFSLASGFLTGKYRSAADFSKSSRGGGMNKYLNDRGFRILAALDNIAEVHTSTPAAISLAWLLSKPMIAAPIASATNDTQLSELMSSVEINLSEDEIKLLDDASAC